MKTDNLEKGMNTKTVRTENLFTSQDRPLLQKL